MSNKPDYLDKVEWGMTQIGGTDILNYKKIHNIPSSVAISIYHRKIRGVGNTFEQLLLKVGKYPELYPDFNWISVYQSSNEMISELEKVGLIMF